MFPVKVAQRGDEARVAELQAQLEADRVLWFSSRPTSRSPFQDDAAVKAAWEKLQRATDLLEAERAVFRDERMAMRELEADIKRREAKLTEVEGNIPEHDKRLRTLITTTPTNTAPGIPAGVSMATSPMKVITQPPFDAAKSVPARKG